ncbi:MKRN2 opposite strand protein [Rhodococcus ruber]|uniref:MKRN2 opposite strand protein n=1 Tax=Rhodococcus ruber TaxID=1830 RepID=UPI001F260DDC|nr:MKRN2 opposite strand protein [Rhodococcus ruber]
MPESVIAKRSTVACMIDWGLRWFRAPEGPAIVLCHRECDHTFTPVLTCSHCGERLRASTVSIEPSGG